MDIARPVDVRRRRLRRALYGAGGLAVVLAITLGLSRLEPADPTVERATVWIDTVKRGPMLRQVRGIGALVPEDIRWIPATTEGRVEKILLQPGTTVEAAAIILVLSNPALEQELHGATLQLASAEAALTNLRVELQNDVLDHEAALAAAEADHQKAALQADVNEQLARKQLVSAMLVRQSQLDVQQLASRLAIARKQLASRGETTAARLTVQQAAVDQARAILELKRQQVEALRVRAGVAGVLQIVPVEVGQQVAPGSNLARVANPARLKAELKIAETQAKDVQVGQAARIDTRNGIVPGAVVRIDPSVQNGTVTVDVALGGDLPKGARPDLSVDGTIELDRLDDVLFVGRPAFGQEESLVGLYRLDPDGRASRVPVLLGRTSVSTVEIRSGLAEGDQVVLSDMSTWDAFDRVQVR